MPEATAMAMHADRDLPPPPPRSAFCVSWLIAASLPTLAAGQRSLFVQRGTAAFDEFGREVVAAGDLDRDGTDDWFVTQPTYGSAGIGHMFLISGRTRAPIFTWTTPALVTMREVTAMADVDGDGRQDIAMISLNAIAVHSGATGARIRTHILPLMLGGGLGAAGDVDRDGIGDLIASVIVSGSVYQAWIVSGDDARLIGTLPSPPVGRFDAVTDFHLVGDLNGDGRAEVLASPTNGGPAFVYEMAPPRMLRFVDVANRNTKFGEQVAIGHVDGDGVLDMLLGELNRACLYSGRTGLLLRTYPTRSTEGFVAFAGDLDADGFTDLALDDLDVLRFVSGATGRTLSVWTYGRSPSIGRPATLAAVGDQDGDGVPDILFGTPYEGPLQQAGATELLSSRVIADAALLDGACGAGPFPLQLGLGRPVLGQSMTIACRDGGVGQLGTLLVSLAPASSAYLGVSTCFLWLDLPSAAVWLQTAQPQWTVSLPVPALPALAGREIAMQAVYGPSLGPLGFDLSNGARGRFGY